MDRTKNGKYKAALEGVKAPLGVILYLIKRDSLDIYDIPIAKITRDYLEYLDLMEELQIELAGDFFVLAATLMRIKAQMLLRRDEDEDDPREELVRNLLEYKKMVEAARNFRDMEEERLKVFNRPVPQREKEYRAEAVFELNLYEIMRAFREIVTEFDGDTASEIDPEVYTIEEKIEIILTTLSNQGQIRFHELFTDSTSRLEIVVTFMAMLELMKRVLITARQERPHGDIWIYAADEHEPLEQSLNQEAPSAHATADSEIVGDLDNDA
ncbi:MAG: segregation/condensation protein A [Candidatus Krumholzibacteria bacterium]|nr:segregation/condensation protein A [Candidatus Krumholzibacteria bacterium]